MIGDFSCSYFYIRGEIALSYFGTNVLFRIQFYQFLVVGKEHSIRRAEKSIKHNDPYFLVSLQLLFMRRRQSAKLS